MSLVFLPPDEPGTPAPPRQSVGLFLLETVAIMLFLATIFGALPLVVQSLEVR